jgi:methyltransferase OMS1
MQLGLQLYGGERKGCSCGRDTDDNGVKSYVFDPRRNETYSKIAHAYDDQIDKDEMVMGINLLRRALLYFHASGEVLEVAAGTGRTLGCYPGPSVVNKITMTDNSEKMLLRIQEKLKKMSKSEIGRVKVAVADAAYLPYLDNSFDTVVDTFGLCSFDDPVGVLKELQRVCKPDGKILLLEHGRSKTFAGLSDYLDKYAERHAKNWGCVWNRDISQIVESSNAIVERFDYWHFGTTCYITLKPNKVQLDQEKKLGGTQTQDRQDYRIIKRWWII